LPSAGKPARDEEAVIAWLDVATNTWQDLTTTVNADGSLTADIMHFTTFAVRFNGVVQNDCGFSACGGDVVGTWTVTGGVRFCRRALNDVCPTAMAHAGSDADRHGDFQGRRHQRDRLQRARSSISYTLSSECLLNIAGGTLPDSCDGLSSEADASSGDGPTVCSGDPQVSATCVQTTPEKTDVEDRHLHDRRGSTMTTTDDADGSTDTLEFCVTGKDGRFQGKDAWRPSLESARRAERARGESGRP